MAMRFLEVSLPAEAADRVPALLSPHPPIDLWTLPASEDRCRLSLLVDARHVEAISDALVAAFGASAGFRIVSMPVEATLPAVVVPEAAPETATPHAPKPDPARVSREELYEDLSAACEVTSTYLAMVAISTLVAGIGLFRGDTAILIGAMVIAPLLGPNVGLALAATLGDGDLARRAGRSIGVGVALATALAWLMGMTLDLDPLATELVRRTHVDYPDVLLALTAGTAGTLAFTTGVPATLVGVMVAVALLPPLVVAGLYAGAGASAPAAGALLLLLTNIVGVNLAAIATFFAQRVRPRTWWEGKRARRATRWAALLWTGLLVVLLGLIWVAEKG